MSNANTFQSKNKSKKKKYRSSFDRSYTKLDRVLMYASGTNPGYMDKCADSTFIKYKTIGVLVFIPAILAILSVNIAATYMTDNFFLGFIGSLIFATIIFFTDRAILMFTKASLYNAGIVIRVALILALSTALAEPFVLILFDGAVHNKIVETGKDSKNQIFDHYELEIENIRKELKGEEAKLDILESNYLKEMDGSGGSQKRGIGKITRAKKKAFDDAKMEFVQKEKTATERIEVLKQERVADLSSIKGKKVDLSVSMNILHQLMGEDFYIAASTWLLRLILILIDFIPIGIKFSVKDKHLGYYKKIQDAEYRKIAKVNRKTETKEEKIALEYRMLMLKEEEFRLQLASAKLKILALKKGSVLKYNEIEKAVKLKKRRLNEIKSMRLSTELKQEFMNQVEAIYSDFILNIGKVKMS